MRAAARILLCLVVLGAVAGCSRGPDGPTSAQGGQRLDGWVRTLQGGLTSGVRPLSPWSQTASPDTDRTGGCEDGRAYRLAGAGVGVPDSGVPDVGSRATLIVGQLGNAGWKTQIPKTDEQTGSGSVMATRSLGGSSATVRIAFTAARGGWTYTLSARTPCLAISDG